MLLIADSGSTKTDWALVESEHPIVVTTQGINPFHQSREDILRVISEELQSQINSSLVEDEYLCLKLNEIDALSPYIYIKKIELKELQKDVHKMFKALDTLEDVKQHIDK